MLSSKEALENLGRINLGDNPYCIFEDNLLKNCCKEEYETIKKNLEILEYLEKENQELKEELKGCQEYIKKSTNDHKNLIIDNGKMKKAFKILKKKTNTDEITEEEYELLKEVLENDNFLLKDAQIYSKKNNEKK